SLQTLTNAWPNELCSSDSREPLHHVRKLVHHADQQNRLYVRPGAPLFSVLQRSRPGAKELREERARKVQSLPTSNQIVGAEFRWRSPTIPNHRQPSCSTG